MKKRILQIIGSFHQGGSERQAVSLSRLLHEDGTFDIFAATLNNEGSLQGEIESIGLPPICEFPLSSFYDARFVRQVWRCARYMREMRIDIVHTHDFYTNIFGMAAAALAGIPARVASKRETAGMRSRRQEFVESIAFGRANAIIANSAAVRDHLIKRSIPADKIHIIFNGMDLGRFVEASRDRESVLSKFGLPPGDNIRFVTQVANLRHTVKNIPMLLRAAKRVIGKEPNTHFVIAGEGGLKNDLGELARRLGIDKNVHFIGRCSDIPALLSISSVCTLTSAAEGFSNSILEYMAAGKPVVATDVGGAAEAIVDGKTGWLTLPDDDAGLAEKLLKLLSDPAATMEMGAAGREVVGRLFSQNRQLSDTSELYNSLLAKR